MLARRLLTSGDEEGRHAQAVEELERKPSSQGRSERGRGRRSGSVEKPRPRGMGGNQGEGNREADRRYREAATAFERSGRVRRAAEEARREIDDDEEETTRARDRAEGGEEELDFDANGGHAYEADFDRDERGRSGLS